MPKERDEEELYLRLEALPSYRRTGNLETQRSREFVWWCRKGEYWE